MKKYDLRKIMKRAWALVKTFKVTISEGLKRAWAEAKTVKNVVISRFYSYNKRRYSRPWVCTMKPDGKYDFSTRVGEYNAEEGCEGNLIVYEPVVGQVYGWGQKDYRGANTEKHFCVWTGSEFVACDKFGELEA